MMEKKQNQNVFVTMKKIEKIALGFTSTDCIMDFL